MDLLKNVSMKLEDIHNARNNELVRENLRRILARNAIKRGVRWIQTHADNRGWWRNCLNYGKSRVRTGFPSESILALVFEYHPEFTDRHHSVNEARITRHFRLPLSQAERCGFINFMGGWKPFPDRYPEIKLTAMDIDRAWGYFLENPPGDWLSPARHWNSEREYFGEPENLRDKLKRLRLKILRNFGNSRQLA